MNRIDTILEKERTNTDRIFLYLKEDRLMAFGYSAYFATWLFPELEVIPVSYTHLTLPTTERV